MQSQIRLVFMCIRTFSPVIQGKVMASRGEEGRGLMGGEGKGLMGGEGRGLMGGEGGIDERQGEGRGLMRGDGRGLMGGEGRGGGGQGLPPFPPIEIKLCVE